MTLVAFEIVIIKESSEPLVDLGGLGFVLDPVYANQGLSDDDRIFLREGVVKKLLELQKALKVYKFKIWDGFRSRTVQNNVYEKFRRALQNQQPDWNAERLNREVGVFVTYAKDLSRIPPHATGGAVDLTLTDISGNDLDMGTSFDHFGPEAASLYFEKHQVDEKVMLNRNLLREAMTSVDFRFDRDEWWHFDYGNQLWAIDLHHPFAIYGETMVPSS